jgi:pimeloyl-ACP methyl ester carboxylesterase
MKMIAVHGAELACCDEFSEGASGAPVVFLHAFPLNQTMWTDQARALRARRRVITFDWRGFGESPLGAAPSSMELFADDLATLLNYFEIERSVICGLSMGGYAALAFYRKYAARVAALVLADTRATADTDEGKRARYETAELARKSGPTALPAAWVDTTISKLLGETTLRRDPKIAERVRAMIESSSAEGIAQASLAMAARADSMDLLERIDCPTLVIVGAEDKLTPPSEAEKMSQKLRNARLEVIAGAGHLSNIEQPDDFNSLIEGFLADL